MKNRKLNQWLWKWHFIAGAISLPFVLVLSITGAIYLFKPNVENKVVSDIQQIKNANTNTAALSYQAQWDIAKNNSKRTLNSMILSEEKNKSTEFISGRFGGKQSLYINPYSGEVSGTFKAKDTWMYTVRKLHGELLGGKVGTKLVELVASWMVVLILTGLYIWFPFVKGAKGVFTIRFKEGKRTLFRDVHAVTGFWMSILLLIVLAGGFPWTDVFGANFKWVQKVTNTGYPKTWSGRGLSSSVSEKSLTLDEMVRIAKQQNLNGVITVGLPKSPKSTFSVSNRTFPLSDQKMLHFDQYSGKLIKHHTWSDVGVLMRARMWLMAFHQGQFGGWNWYLLFFTAIALTIMSIGAIFSYAYRKQKGKLGIPKSPKKLNVGKGIVVLLLLLSIVFPLFGVSLLLILGIEFLKRRFKTVNS
ncbi:PepSY-associated TM helix domain-containing protein [Tenacibaculum sp. M341]|uniref:PepSY-associated TM helix domain-containing protein n=1 Tax=Tenacibaculum sp. M341 TaxID=2530339 RepID=UPI0010485CD7|nr:PepSY domain-containing protein [Tenacibaculum sp. M341]TCI93040.1 PepSY domain-containing protein [Tenacibaculum sp. M341]